MLCVPLLFGGTSCGGGERSATCPRSRYAHWHRQPPWPADADASDCTVPHMRPLARIYSRAAIHFRSPAASVPARNLCARLAHRPHCAGPSPRSSGRTCGARWCTTRTPLTGMATTAGPTTLPCTRCTSASPTCGGSRTGGARSSAAAAPAPGPHGSCAATGCFDARCMRARVWCAPRIGGMGHTLPVIPPAGHQVLCLLCEEIPSARPLLPQDRQGINVRRQVVPVLCQVLSAGPAADRRDARGCRRSTGLTFIPQGGRGRVRAPRRIL